MKLIILLWRVNDYDAERAEAFQSMEGAVEFLGREVVKDARKHIDKWDIEDAEDWEVKVAAAEASSPLEKIRTWQIIIDKWFGPRGEWKGDYFYAIEEKEVRS